MLGRVYSRSAVFDGGAEPLGEVVLAQLEAVLVPSAVESVLLDVPPRA